MNQLHMQYGDEFRAPNKCLEFTRPRPVRSATKDPYPVAAVIVLIGFAIAFAFVVDIARASQMGV